MRKARLIRVEIEESSETGMLYATSPDMRELFVSRRSIEGLMEAVPQAIEALMECRGESVIVCALEDHDPHTPPPWVIVPRDAEARAH